MQPRNAVRALAGALFLLAAGTAAASAQSAENSGTPEEQQACMPDVFRLCSAEIPSEQRIVACLLRMRAQLSPACRAVFSGPPRHSRPMRTARAGKPLNLREPHRKARPAKAVKAGKPKKGAHHAQKRAAR